MWQNNEHNVAKSKGCAGRRALGSVGRPTWWGQGGKGVA